jgi:hypothetical protein
MSLNTTPKGMPLSQLDIAYACWLSGWYMGGPHPSILTFLAERLAKRETGLRVVMCWLCDAGYYHHQQGRDHCCAEQ